MNICIDFFCPLFIEFVFHLPPTKLHYLRKFWKNFTQIIGSLEKNVFHLIQEDSSFRTLLGNGWFDCFSVVPAVLVHNQLKLRSIKVQQQYL